MYTDLLSISHNKVWSLTPTYSSAYLISPFFCSYLLKPTVSYPLTASMRSHVLRQSPAKDDDSWDYQVSQDVLRPPRSTTSDVIWGKLIVFSRDAITLTMQRLPANRVLRVDDPSKFVLVSFGGFRLPDTTLRESADYIFRLLSKGLFLNGIQYRFYHHSNSQLVYISATVDTLFSSFPLLFSVVVPVSFVKPRPIRSSMIEYIPWGITAR